MGNYLTQLPSKIKSYISEEILIFKFRLRLIDISSIFRVNNASILVSILPVIFSFNLGVSNTISSSAISSSTALHPLQEDLTQKEVFGFMPYWNIDKLDNVDFNTLTTLAYFGVPVEADGSLDRYDPGYLTFKSSQATDLFTRAHSYGTRVVLTIIQMDNSTIESILDDPVAFQNAINQTVSEVMSRGIDGVNIDFEYQGDPGNDLRNNFTNFVSDLTKKMHQLNPDSRVTVSVYAASAKEPKLYDVSALSQVSDGIFMMAYDFANASSANAIPTAPLNGAQDGQYWYDVTTAVNDFLSKIPADKLILGVPWYGYNYMVYQPGILALVRPSSWWGSNISETYSDFMNSLTSGQLGNVTQGWDKNGQVEWTSYYDNSLGTWRMVFMDNPKSLALKYDLAKQKNLEGIGIWALGNDQGRNDLWQELADVFGKKIADNAVLNREIRG